MCENFIYTGLLPVPSLCHFVLTLVALVVLVSSPFAIVSIRVLLPAMSSASSWKVCFGSW